MCFIFLNNFCYESVFVFVIGVSSFDHFGSDSFYGFTKLDMIRDLIVKLYDAIGADAGHFADFFTEFSSQRFGFFAGH